MKSNIKKKLYKVLVHDNDDTLYDEYFICANNHEEVRKKVNTEYLEYSDVVLHIETIQLLEDEVII